MSDSLIAQLLAIAKDRGMSRRDLARRVGIANSTMVRMAKGGNTNMALIECIAAALSVDLVALARKKISKKQK